MYSITEFWSLYELNKKILVGMSYEPCLVLSS